MYHDEPRLQNARPFREKSMNLKRLDQTGYLAQQRTFHTWRGPNPSDIREIWNLCMKN